MQRVVTAIIALLMIAAICGELTCFAEEEATDCCETVSCSMCSHSVFIVEPIIAPLPVIGAAGIVMVKVVSPETPDLAHLTPPPIA